MNPKRPKEPTFPLEHPLLNLPLKRKLTLKTATKLPPKSSKLLPLPDFPLFPSFPSPMSQKLIPLRFSKQTPRSALRTPFHPLTPLRQKTLIKENSARGDNDRLMSMYKKMLEPKVLRIKVFDKQGEGEGTKRRAMSADQRDKLPLLFTFGKMGGE